MIRTEMRNPRTTHIDRMTTEEMVSLIAKENYAVVKAVEEQTMAISLTDAISESLLQVSATTVAPISFAAFKALAT